MFIAIYFVIVKNWKQPNCPSAVKWILQTMVYSFNGILFSNREKHSTDTSCDVDELQSNMQSRISQTRVCATCFLLYKLLEMQNIVKEHRSVTAWGCKRWEVVWGRDRKEEGESFWRWGIGSLSWLKQWFYGWIPM